MGRCTASGRRLFDDPDPPEYTPMTMQPLNGRKHRRTKAAPKRREDRMTKTQLEAGRAFLAESPVKPTAEGMAAIHRELHGK
jgi:hypothetical protein